MYYKNFSLKLFRAGLIFYRYAIAQPLQRLGLIGNSTCRFYPTCSEYAEEVIIRYGWWRGLGLAAKRLAQCNPLANPVRIHARAQRGLVDLGRADSNGAKIN